MLLMMWFAKLSPIHITDAGNTNRRNSNACNRRKPNERKRNALDFWSHRRDHMRILGRAHYQHDNEADQAEA